MDEIEDLDLQPERPWQIENTSSLDWALSRLAKLGTQRKHIEASAMEAHNRIASRCRELTDKLDRGIAFFQSAIEKYCTENREWLLGGGKAKSREFLNGKVGWRKRAGRLVVTDNDALKGWLMAQPDDTLYRVRVEPEMAALQKRFQAMGEIPPGCEFVAEQEKIYVDAIDTERMLPNERIPGQDGL